MSLLPALVIFLTGSTMIIAAEPAWKYELSPTEPGPHQVLTPGTLEYEISWKGIVQSGKVTMEIGKAGDHKPGMVIVQSTATSMGLAAAIFPYRGRSWAEIRAETLMPTHFSSWEQHQAETIHTTNRFQTNRVISKEITREDKQAQETVEQQEFPHGPAFEIGSVLLHIRSQRLKDGDQMSLLVHPFNSPYLMRVKVLGRELHMGRNSIKLSVEMRKIDRKTQQLKPYKKLKKPAHLWLSDDAQRLPVELRADAFIGDIRASLVGFKAAPKAD